MDKAHVHYCWSASRGGGREEPWSALWLVGRSALMLTEQVCGAGPQTCRPQGPPSQTRRGNSTKQKLLSLKLTQWTVRLALYRQKQLRSSEWWGFTIQGLFCSLFTSGGRTTHTRTGGCYWFETTISHLMRSQSGAIPHMVFPFKSGQPPGGLSHFLPI